MKIQSTDENGVRMSGKFAEFDEYTERERKTDSKFVSWGTLRDAAKQDDKQLATAYAEILQQAERLEARRVISDDWKQYGYPLRTGFGRQYAGQIVQRAWETRRVQRGGKDLRIAYIVTWDRSDNSFTRRASPEFSTHDEALDWVSDNYGGWHDELGGERTAGTWFVG